MENTPNKPGQKPTPSSNNPSRQQPSDKAQRTPNDRGITDTKQPEPGNKITPKQDPSEDSFGFEEEE